MTRRRRLRLTRDLVLYCVALSGFVYELVKPGGADSGAMTACLAILLAPYTMSLDEYRRRRRDQDRQDEP